MTSEKGEGNTQLVILLSVIALIAIGMWMVPSTSKPSLSPYILQITSPVMSISGIVDSVSGDTIAISQQSMMPGYMPPLPMTGAISGTPAPTPIKVSYTVKITKQTVFSKPYNNMVNYLFPKPISTSATLAGGMPPFAGILGGTFPQATLKDVKKGTTITVNSLNDLRTSGKQITATSITLPPAQTTLSGTIKEVRVNTFVMSVPSYQSPMSSMIPTPTMKEYEVEVTSDTEISRYKYNAPTASDKPMMPAQVVQTPERLGMYDLKKGNQVTVYTNVDIADVSKLKALRVEPAPATLAQ